MIFQVEFRGLVYVMSSDGIRSHLMYFSDKMLPNIISGLSLVIDLQSTCYSVYSLLRNNRLRLLDRITL